MVKKQLWIFFFLMNAAWLQAAETNHLVSIEEHNRRVNLMKQIAAGSDGKIEIEVIRDVESSAIDLAANDQQPVDLATRPITETGPSDAYQIRSTYVQALRFYRKKQPRQALGLLLSLLARYPGHDFAGNWRYWCGECNMALHKEANAVDCWQQALTNGPCGKADYALLRLVQYYHRQGNREKTGELLDRLLNDFPLSDAAAIAGMWAGNI